MTPRHLLKQLGKLRFSMPRQEKIAKNSVVGKHLSNIPRSYNRKTPLRTVFVSPQIFWMYGTISFIISHFKVPMLVFEVSV